MEKLKEVDVMLNKPLSSERGQGGKSFGSLSSIKLSSYLSSSLLPIDLSVSVLAISSPNDSLANYSKGRIETTPWQEFKRKINTDKFLLI